MKTNVPYEDAVDLLDADHKTVKKLFIDFNALCEDAAPPAAKQAIADKICRALVLHATLEEEIFYPAVREATGDKVLVEEALDEHAQAKEAIATIQAMDAGDDGFDATVRRLGELVDAHVLEEREQMFLEARQAPMDLKGLAVQLFELRQALLGDGAKSKSTSKKRVLA